MQKIVCRDFSAHSTVARMRTSQLPPADGAPGQGRSLGLGGSPGQGRSAELGGRPDQGAPPGKGCADPTGEEFLGRLGDEIDDRVAEVLPEILGEHRPPGRPGPSLTLAAFGLLAGLAATFMLRDSMVAVCVAWLSAAVVCLAAALAGRRRP